MKSLKEEVSELLGYLEDVRREVTDQDIPWFYQIGNKMEKIRRLLNE